MISIIAKLKANSILKICSEVNNEYIEERKHQHLPFNDEISTNIRNGTTIASSDALVKDGKYNGY